MTKFEKLWQVVSWRKFIISVPDVNVVLLLLKLNKIDFWLTFSYEQTMRTTSFLEAWKLDNPRWHTYLCQPWPRKCIPRGVKKKNIKFPESVGLLRLGSLEHLWDDDDDDDFFELMSSFFSCGNTVNWLSSWFISDIVCSHAIF